MAESTDAVTMFRLQRVASRIGPVALVTGGNHGDEYEGQLIARRLFARLEPADLPGTLIVMRR